MVLPLLASTLEPVRPGWMQEASPRQTTSLQKPPSPRHAASPQQKFLHSWESETSESTMDEVTEEAGIADSSAMETGIRGSAQSWQRVSVGHRRSFSDGYGSTAAISNAAGLVATAGQQYPATNGARGEQPRGEQTWHRRGSSSDAAVGLPLRVPSPGATPADAGPVGHLRYGGKDFEYLEVGSPPSRLQCVGIESPEEGNPKVKLPKVKLPPEAAGWTRFEVDLFLLSEGEYHPEKMARLRRLPTRQGGIKGSGAYEEVHGRVSVLSPTMSSRQHYHEQLWACFEAQTWQDKELIVVETYERSPSEFLERMAKQDSRLIHISFRRPPGCDFSVGLKRNMTMHLASGNYVANFDDDDIYAATYLSKMVGEMQARSLSALTLSTWYNYIVPRRVCAYSDPVGENSDADSWTTEDADELEEVLYGYGFSYVHLRKAGLALPYPNVYFAEDAPFFLTLKEELGASQVGLLRDEEGLCMHIVHRANSTGCEGESISRELLQEELDGLAVAGLPVFQRFLDLQNASWWELLPFLRWQPATPRPLLTSGLLMYTCRACQVPEKGL